MPRGSRPGERRGGRQRGTPNKKTALKNAVLCAAAAHPNASPLDFMLGLMRDPKVPTELRMELASAAAPFVHARPKDPRSEPPSASRSGSLLKIPHASLPSEYSARKMEAELSAVMPEVAGSADLAPLEFLLIVMNDGDAMPQQRIKAARVAARYRHTYAQWVKPPIVIDDPYGFDFDPALARALRDDKWRAYQVFQKRLLQKTSESPEETELNARIAETAKALQCPAGYGPREAMRDSDQLHKLFCKRISPGPHMLSEAEDAEEAHLTARVAAYEVSPEGQGRSRISELGLQSFGKRGLSAAEKAELDELRTRYPDLPNDDPVYLAIEEYLKKRTQGQ
jgi:hypothetical protein